MRNIQRSAVAALVMSLLGAASALAQPLLTLENASRPSARLVSATAPTLEAGLPNFFELLFGGLQPPRPPWQHETASAPERNAIAMRPPETEPAAQRPPLDPKFLPQTVAYHGPEKSGTIIVDTSARFLYLVQENGQAIRYGIGVGRPGFTWSGVKQITAKREWPDWIPPEEMLRRQPGLPHFMAGGPDNPLGARALYLGSSLYRIHGSNEPWTIGQAVSSGCIRMRNEDVIDLYNRVKLGTKVVVI